VNESGTITVSERLSGIDSKLDRILDRLPGLEAEAKSLGQRVAAIESTRDWLIRSIVGAIVLAGLGALGLSKYGH